MYRVGILETTLSGEPTIAWSPKIYIKYTDQVQIKIKIIQILYFGNGQIQIQIRASLYFKYKYKYVFDPIPATGYFRALTHIQGCLSASTALMRLLGFTVNIQLMRFFASDVTVSHSGDGYCDRRDSH